MEQCTAQPSFATPTPLFSSAAKRCMKQRKTLLRAAARRPLRAMIFGQWQSHCPLPLPLFFPSSCCRRSCLHRRLLPFLLLGCAQQFSAAHNMQPNQFFFKKKKKKICRSLLCCCAIARSSDLLRIARSSCCSSDLLRVARSSMLLAMHSSPAWAQPMQVIC
jgi:hypothetical protein